MISKKHRFHGYNSLRYVYNKGQTTRGQFFAVKHAPNQRRQDYRLAVVVSKKVAKSATERNRIRRRLYEIVRKNEADIAGAQDIIITVFHQQVADLPAKKLESTALQQLRQAGIMVKKVRRPPKAEAPASSAEPDTA